MEAIDRRLVIHAVQMVAKRIHRVEQPHAEPLPTAVRLHNKRAVAKTPLRRLDEQFLAGHENGIRSADAGGFEGGVLACLADFEVEGAAAVDDATTVSLDPSKH